MKSLQVFVKDFFRFGAIASATLLSILFEVLVVQIAMRVGSVVSDFIRLRLLLLLRRVVLLRAVPWSQSRCNRGTTVDRSDEVRPGGIFFKRDVILATADSIFPLVLLIGPDVPVGD